MSDDSSRWSDVGARIEQSQGAVHVEMFGDANLIVSSPMQSFEDTEPYLALIVHYPTDIDDREDDEPQSASVNLSVSPETARELGEWLIEHADDEPEPFPGGDGA